MSVHVAQVFLFGAYKYPRELTWIAGVFLLLCTLAMAFTGQVLRFDQDAYWGLGIGAAIAGRMPLLGREVVHLLLGGPIIAGETLSRFFTMHVFVMPGLLIAFVALHLLLVLRLGVNEWPMPGRVVSRATYRREYEELVEARRRGRSFRMRRSATSSSPGSSSSPCSPAPRCSDPSVRTASPIRPSSRPRRARTSTSSGSSRSSRSCRRGPRPSLILTAPVARHRRCSSRCRSSPAPARRAGCAGRCRSSASCSSS